MILINVNFFTIPMFYKAGIDLKLLAQAYVEQFQSQRLLKILNYKITAVVLTNILQTKLNIFHLKLIYKIIIS